MKIRIEKRLFLAAGALFVASACNEEGAAVLPLDAEPGASSSLTASDATSAAAAVTASKQEPTAQESTSATAPLPYSGVPAPVPGLIEAETFDHGGQDVAYVDHVAGNAGGEFRTDEDVDIIVSADAEVPGYEVNNFETGEWLGYTVDVAEVGTYAVELRASSAFTDSAYRIEIDGADVTGSVPVPNTSAWESYAWLEPQHMTLTAGTHFVKVIADKQYFNFNALRISRVAGTTPFHGSAAVLPGTIEAEDFDLGGQNVAYFDRVAGNAGGYYRTAEDVDIVLTNDKDGGTFDVNNFETGEWLSYTVEVPADGAYDIVLRVSSKFDTSAFHVEVDDVNVTGRVPVPNTRSWNRYEDVVAGGVSLTAGEHRLKIVADEQYFNLNRFSVRTTEALATEPAGSEPWGGEPAPMPGTIGAGDFDIGGEGVAYHDTTAGNTGGAHRPEEDVDIIAAGDTSVSAFDVNNFDTGEWLVYTVDVDATAEYDVELKVSSAFADSVASIEIDGTPIGSTLPVPNTGSWNAYQWVGVYDVPLSAGTHVVRVIAEQQYFNLNALRIAVPETTSTIDPDSVLFSCTFPDSATDCGFREQSKEPGRASLTSIARDGSTGVRLHTEPGDDEVAGSGSAERTDLWITQEATDGYQGREVWWAHSILFPDDYVAPPSGWGVVFDFHNTASGAWQANFHVDAGPDGLGFRGYGGVNSGDGRYGAAIGPVQKNLWYDFVYHVRWSSGDDGFMDAWVNGELLLSHRGPTLYEDQGVYLKLANYHSAFGEASSVIHDRVIRGTTALSVSDRPLEGVLELVDGVLTPVGSE